MCNEHNGWVNRETWCVSLHLSNDYDLYCVVQSWAITAIKQAVEDRESVAVDFPDLVESGSWKLETRAAMILGDRLSDRFEEVAQEMLDHYDSDTLHPVVTPLNRIIAAAIHDVGSLYRVEWRDLATSYITEALAEMEAPS